MTTRRKWQRSLLLMTKQLESRVTTIDCEIENAVLVCSQSEPCDNQMTSAFTVFSRVVDF